LLASRLPGRTRQSDEGVVVPAGAAVTGSQSMRPRNKFTSDNRVRLRSLQSKAGCGAWGV